MGLEKIKNFVEDVAFIRLRVSWLTIQLLFGLFRSETKNAEKMALWVKRDPL